MDPGPWGTHKPSSDIDLVLVGCNLSFALLQTINQEIDDLFLPYTVDLSVYEQITHDNLLDHIARVGKTLYRKTKRARQAIPNA